MRTRLLFQPLAVAAAWAALCASTPVFAHCGANEKCIDDPCHHGADNDMCRQATGGARAAARIQAPEVKQAVQEVIIPKVPQLNLPVGGAPRPAGAPRPPSLPAPPGQVDARAPAVVDARPLPPRLPPSVIARDVVPQVYGGAIAVAREIDHQRALDELRQKDPRLANSAWLAERRQIKLGEAYRQLERIDARARGAIEGLGPEPRYDDLRDSLGRASRLLQSFGSGDRPEENKR